MKMCVVSYLDTILVPLSLLLTASYHAYLWYNINNNPYLTIIGANAIRRRMWARSIKEDNEKKGILAVQSIRNSLMSTILVATAAVIMTNCLAALINNTFNARHLLNGKIFGLQSTPLLALKYGSVMITLLISFLCSSMALGCLNEGYFLVNVTSDEFSPPGYAYEMLERGFMLAIVGNRALYITIPIFLWLIGPVPMALSSVVLAWMFYEIDFAGKDIKNRLVQYKSMSCDSCT